MLHPAFSPRCFDWVLEIYFITRRKTTLYITYNFENWYQINLKKNLWRYNYYSQCSVFGWILVILLCMHIVYELFLICDTSFSLSGWVFWMFPWFLPSHFITFPFTNVNFAFLQWCCSDSVLYFSVGKMCRLTHLYREFDFRMIKGPVISNIRG